MTRRKEAIKRLDATLARVGARAAEISDDEAETIRQYDELQRRINIREGYGD